MYPVGCAIILTGTAPNGVPLVALGYKYNSKKVLLFASTRDAGSTRAGKPYKMSFTDEHGNVCVQWVDWPQIADKFFSHSNILDRHNHFRQYEL